MPTFFLPGPKGTDCKATYTFSPSLLRIAGIIRRPPLQAFSIDAQPATRLPEGAASPQEPLAVVTSE